MRRYRLTQSEVRNARRGDGNKDALADTKVELV